MLIDEYDNFANTVLAHCGAEAYQSFSHGGDFYRNFFATLKVGAEQSDGCLEQLFLTGVLPITMDDVTSGFNLGHNINLLEMYRDYDVFNQECRSCAGSDAGGSPSVPRATVAAHLSMVDHFLLHSEYELNKGYADLYLESFLAQYSEVRFGYVLELKYLKRSKSLTESLIAEKGQEAVPRVRDCLADPSLRRYPSVRHTGLVGVFHGWEMVTYEALDDDAAGH